MDYLEQCCSAKSAQAWCAPSTETKVLDEKLAMQFGKMLYEPVKLLEELRDYTLRNSPSSENFRCVQEASKYLEEIKSILKSVDISYNYSRPIQTSSNKWSVFVRKFDHEECVSVVEHKFSSPTDAEKFSTNNWNLGEYF
jgi:hypothetical protein